MVLLGYLVEYFPGYLGRWDLRVIHPLYGVAWLGGGELLAAGSAWIARSKRTWSPRDLAGLLTAAAALASVPVVMWKANNAGFLAVDLQSFRLTKQMDAVLSPNFLQWLTRDGFSATVWATVSPILLLVTVGWFLASKAVRAVDRGGTVVVLGPTLVVLTLAYFGLRWWQVFDGLLLVLIVMGTSLVSEAGSGALRRWLWVGFLGTTLVAGAFQVIPARGNAVQNVLSLPEVEGLVERDLAHWLAKYSSAQAATIVLAPPSVTSALNFYGGLRGLGTFAWENKDGLSVALRVVISTSREEALALLRRREVTHIVIPSWNPFFEDYTRSASVQNGEMFYTGLHRWALPLWLRPVPYQLPKIAGFEQHTVMVLERVDEQDEPVAMSRVAEYFIEMGQLDQARATGQALRRFPADFGALIARAQVEVGVGDAAAFNAVMETVIRRLASGADRFLPWDRRVSLAVALARAKRMDLARIQVERCLAEIDETRVRSLTAYSLFHLEFLRKAFGLAVADARMRDLITHLAPAE